MVGTAALPDSILRRLRSLWWNIVHNPVVIITGLITVAFIVGFAVSFL